MLCHFEVKKNFFSERRGGAGRNLFFFFGKKRDLGTEKKRALLGGEKNEVQPAGGENELEEENVCGYKKKIKIQVPCVEKECRYVHPCSNTRETRGSTKEVSSLEILVSLSFFFPIFFLFFFNLSTHFFLPHCS